MQRPDPRARPLGPRLASALGTGLGSGLVTVYPLGRAPRAVRRTWVAVPALLAPAAVVVAAAERDPRPRATRITLLATGVGTVVAASQVLSLVVDRAIEDALRRHGFRSPRLVMGAVSAIVMTGVSFLSDEAPAPAPSVT